MHSAKCHSSYCLELTNILVHMSLVYPCMLRHSTEAKCFRRLFCQYYTITCFLFMFVCAHGGVHMFRVSLFLHLLCLAARAEWQLYLLFMQRSLWSKPWADFCICVHVSSFVSSPTCCSYDFYFGVCMYGIFCINCVAGSFYLNILLWGLYYRLCLITCNISAPINQLNSCWTEGRVNFKNKRQCTTCSMWYPFNKSWLGFNTDKVIMQQHLRRGTSTRLLPAHLHLLTWIVTVYPPPPPALMTWHTLLQ